MDIYEIIQVGHLVVFGILLAVPSLRLLSRTLLLSAVVYLIAESLGKSGYAFDAIFDFCIACLVIRMAPFEAKLQALVLFSLSAFSCLAWIEFPTEGRLIYDSYAIVTNGLNLLQVVVMGSALWDVISQYISRVDFHCRIVYNLYLESIASCLGDLERPRQATREIG